MATEAQIVSFLKEKYNPTSILLHGSRARGDAGLASDWDVALVLRDLKGRKEGKVDRLDDAEIDCEFFSAQEINASETAEKFKMQFSDAKVLHDELGEGAAVVAKAREIVARGINLNQEQIANRKITLSFYINKMRGYTDHPVAFEIRIHEALDRLTRYWLETKKNSFGKSPRVAVAEIQKEDPAFYDVLLGITKAPYQDRISLLEKASEYIFDGKPL